jgi:hypothetical protein
MIPYPSMTISARIARIVAMVDRGEWKHSRIPAYRIISECEALLERPRALALLTDSERQWLTGAVVWVSESLEDAARGEGVYMD